MAESQSDLQAYADKGFKRVDSALDRKCQHLLAKAKREPVAVEKIVNAQRAWLAFHDTDLEAMYPCDEKQGGYGTAYRMCVLVLKADLTRQRMKMPDTMLNRIEGDVCNAGVRYMRTSQVETAPSRLSLNSSPTEVTSNGHLTQLFSRIWRVTDPPLQSAPGSIYVFLPNGTLLETYRIAAWTIDKKAPRVFRVVEDGRLAFTATIVELTDSTLRLRQNLIRSDEKRDITLTAVEQEFVCPDLRR
jgi:uncharacterized protein YecT (DUF1311 family)